MQCNSALFKVSSEHSRSRTLSSGTTNSTNSTGSGKAVKTNSTSNRSLDSTGIASVSSFGVPPAIVVTDSTPAGEQKPAIRKPLGPPLRKSRSLDHGLKRFSSSNSFVESSSDVQTPTTSTVSLIPAGFDPTEYEFLTQRNTEENNDANNNDDLGLDLRLGASAVSNSASNSSLVGLLLKWCYVQSCERKISSCVIRRDFLFHNFFFRDFFFATVTKLLLIIRN